jgi:hypothetical protein
MPVKKMDLQKKSSYSPIASEEKNLRSFLLARVTIAHTAGSAFMPSLRFIELRGMPANSTQF